MGEWRRNVGEWGTIEGTGRGTSGGVLMVELRRVK